MVSLQVILQLVIVGLIVGYCSFVFYAIASDTRNRRSPAGPTGTPIPPTSDFFVLFVNERSDSIYVVPTIGSADDTNNWTLWDPTNPITPGTSKYNPHSLETVYRRLAPGESFQVSGFIQGMAGVSYVIRTNCSESTMICDKGDSDFVYGLDGPNPSDLKRGSIPFKPAIDTRIEFTWGCLYDDPNLCGVNPSCITNQSAGCAPITVIMGANPGAKFHKDGLLYASDGITNIGLTAGVRLDSHCFYDISCVDGFTVPLIMEVQRPPTSFGSSGTSCDLQTSSSPLDNISAPTGTWQIIANTTAISLSQCPTTENLWPPPKQVASLAGHTGDGYNPHVGVTGFPLAYVTEGTPGFVGQPKLNATFTGGSKVDLRIFRNPAEVPYLPGSSIENVIGCAGPCSILTKNGGGNSMIYPLTGGHVFSTGTYLVDPVHNPLLSTDRGVSEICCKAQGSVVTDSNLQCNTSTWWTDPPGMNGPAAPNPAIVTDYNFGFYSSSFAPAPPTGTSNPWWSNLPAPTGSSINPYDIGVAGADKYVNYIRGDTGGQFAKSRAYSYAHDDAWNTVVCGTVDPVNLINPSGSRGPYYDHYKIRVRIRPDT